MSHPYYGYGSTIENLLAGAGEGFMTGVEWRDSLAERRRQREIRELELARQAELDRQAQYDWQMARGVERVGAMPAGNAGVAPAIGRRMRGATPDVAGRGRAAAPNPDPGFYRGGGGPDPDPGFSRGGVADPNLDPGFYRGNEVSVEPSFGRGTPDLGFRRNPALENVEPAPIIGGYQQTRATPAQNEEFHRAELAAAVGNKLTQMVGTHDEFTPQERTLVGLGMLPAEKPLSLAEELRLRQKYYGPRTTRRDSVGLEFSRLVQRYTQYTFDENTGVWTPHLTKPYEELAQLAEDIVDGRVDPSEYAVTPPPAEPPAPEAAPKPPSMWSRIGSAIGRAADQAFQPHEPAPEEVPADTGVYEPGNPAVPFEMPRTPGAGNLFGPTERLSPATLELRLKAAQKEWDEINRRHGPGRKPRPRGIRPDGSVY